MKCSVILAELISSFLITVKSLSGSTNADHADLSFRKNESKWHQLVDAGDNRLYPIACNWTETKEVYIVISLKYKYVLMP